VRIAAARTVRRFPGLLAELNTGGLCAFVAADGRRCTETDRIEFHHRVPFAEGDEATAANIALRCRAHNPYEAGLDFGPDVEFVREAAAIWS